MKALVVVAHTVLVLLAVQISSASAQESVGRFQVAQARDATVLVDTMTGQSWLLSVEKGEAKWLPILPTDDKQATKLVESKRRSAVLRARRVALEQPA